MNFLKQYITLGKFDITEVLPHIISHNVNKRLSKKKYEYLGEQYTVKMNSKRYQVFNKSIFCNYCNLPGSYFLLQQHRFMDRSSAPYVAHFNLFAEDIFNINDGNIILMTIDHVMPTSKGGTDNLDNLVTACSICNGKKDNKILEL